MQYGMCAREECIEERNLLFLQTPLENFLKIIITTMKKKI